jgi:hypothetical protein
MRSDNVRAMYEFLILKANNDIEAATPPPPLRTKLSLDPARGPKIARLAEWNNPLLVHASLRPWLEEQRFSGLGFYDVRFCSLYVGTGVYGRIADAAA